MINQIYLSVLFRAKSVKENIYKSLLTLSTCAHTTAHTHESTLEMTIKYKQNSCQEQQQQQEKQQPRAKSKTKPQQDDQVECPAANFKCAQSNNNNSCCGGVFRSKEEGEARRGTSGKQKKLAQRKVHKTYLGKTSLSST